jgi:hypothetical protein
MQAFARRPSSPVRGDDDRMRPVDGESLGRALSGELITETLDYDGGREVTVYVPPKRPTAVVFAGDGELISQWGDMLEAADVVPTMIVGVHHVADETLRLHEYSPRFDPLRFAAHEKFFVDDVRGSRQAANSHSHSGFGIRTSSALSSARRRVRVTSRPYSCRVHSRARISSPARSSPSSLTTRLGGHLPCTMRVAMSSCVSAPDPTAARSGERSSH